MEYNPYSFFHTDIIVWNGIVVQYGSVSHLIVEGDNIRKANELETKAHNVAPQVL